MIQTIVLTLLLHFTDGTKETDQYTFNTLKDCQVAGEMYTSTINNIIGTGSQARTRLYDPKTNKTYQFLTYTCEAK